MVTTPEMPEPPATTKEDLINAAYAAGDSVARGARSFITGNPNGRVRRNVLFIVTLLGIIASAPIVSLPALALLMLTDMVVEVDG